MVQAVRHLHEAKIEEVAERLRGEGYTVRRGPQAGHVEFDLVAEKEGRNVAVEVKDAIELRASARDVMRLRDLALEQGFNDFRVIVVNPPQKKNIAVPGLDAVLLACLRQAPPERLTALSDRLVVRRVHGVDVD